MKRNNLWLLAIAFLIIAVMVVLGNVMVIGDHLAKIPHFEWLSYVFYGLIAILFVWVFVVPAARIHFAPEIPSLSVDNQEDMEELRKFAHTLANNCSYIPNKKIRESHAENLRRRINLTGGDRSKIREVIEKEIKTRIEGNPEIEVAGINKLIDFWAERVLITTALSQNSNIDSVLVLWTNYKMVSDLVNASGFRPNARQLVKIYFNVVGTALFSYALSEGLSDIDGVQPFDFGEGDSTELASDIGVESSDPSEDGSSFLMGILRKFKIPGFIVSSMLDGATNALLTYRIGYITRAYITEGHEKFEGKANRRRIRRKAIKESFKRLPHAIKVSSSQVTAATTGIVTKLANNM